MLIKSIEMLFFFVAYIIPTRLVFSLFCERFDLLFNHIIGSAIWDKLLECIFENFQKSRE